VAGGFQGALDEGNHSGAAVASLRDLDGDRVTDIVAGAPGDDDGGTDHGALWVTFLGTDSPVRDERKISQSSGGFTGTLDSQFGIGVSNLGDSTECR